MFEKLSGRNSTNSTHLLGISEEKSGEICTWKSLNLLK